jgi:hypothetical protein
LEIPTGSGWKFRPAEVLNVFVFNQHAAAKDTLQRQKAKTVSDLTVFLERQRQRQNLTRGWNSAMAETIQIDYRKLAAEKFPGFNIHGNGAFACFDGATNSVHLFEFELIARATGRHVQQIQIAQRRAFRKKFHAD